MKKRNKMLVLALTLSTLLLAGCSANKEAHLDHIGLDAAKEMAVKNAEIPADARIVYVSTELDDRNGQKYYDIEFIADGHKYEYDIDALTGIVIESKKPVIKEEETYTQENLEELAKNVEEQYQKNKELEEELEQIWEQYEKVEEVRKKIEEEKTELLPIDEEKAKEIALEHAGVKKEDATFVTVYQKEEDGIIGYEVEFYDKNYVEYDYFIEMSLGNILDFDSDAEYTYASESNNSESSLNIQSENGIEETVETISEQKAKEIALAQVPGAAENDIYGFEVDRDDGRISYEGSIIFNEMEYDFEIDGYSGAIREWDAESIHD